MSGVVPAVSDQLPVLGKTGGEGAELLHGSAPGTFDVPLLEGLPAPHIEEHEVALLFLDLLDDVRLLFLGTELCLEVVSVGTDLIPGESHLLASSGTDESPGERTAGFRGASRQDGALVGYNSGTDCHLNHARVPGAKSRPASATEATAPQGRACAPGPPDRSSASSPTTWRSTWGPR